MDADALRDFDFGLLEETLSPRNAMLYALTVGAGADPLDPNGLRFVYEAGLQPFPTVPTIVCNPAGWTTDPRTRINQPMLVHGSTSVTNHQPLPIGRALKGACKVIGLEDKGDKGAVITLSRTVTDAATGALYATVLSQAFARADGHFGGDWGERPVFETAPSSSPDCSVEVETRPDAALLYRLNGDYNPLHAEPAFARRAGFERPILHGLGAFGAVAWGLLRALAPAGTLSLFEARFSRPVFPGDRLSLDLWRAGDTVQFQARVAARNVTVLDFGRAILTS